MSEVPLKQKKKPKFAFSLPILKNEVRRPRNFQQKQKKQFLQFKKTAASKRLKGVLLFDDVFLKVFYNVF